MLAPKSRLLATMFGTVCALSTMDMATTVAIAPGSSGGPLLNDKNELVGITSAGGPYNFGYFVRLQDIQAFLRDK